MAVFYVSLLMLAAQACAQNVGKFFSPPNMPPGQINHAENDIMHVGETISVEWSTTFSEYTIALWQQELDFDGAIMGPIVFETRSPAKPEFLWTVQRFSFDIRKSAVFFLWLHPGDSSQQGDKRNASFATRYFNISGDPAPSSTTLLPVTTSLASVGSSTATSSTNANGPSSTAKSTESTASTTPTANIPGSNNPTETGQPSLSTGALVGIAVSAGLAGILAVVCVILWYRRGGGQRQGSGDPLLFSTGSQSEQGPSGIPVIGREREKENHQYHSGPWHSQASEQHYASQARRPAEMLGTSNGRHEPAELA